MRLIRHLRQIGLVPAMFAILLVAKPAVAADVDIAQMLEERERDAAASTEFVYRLGLSRTQARKLVPILEEAAEIHISSYEAEVELLPQMIEAYTDFLEEDKADQGFSRAVERRAGQLHHQEITGPEEATRQLIALQDKASEILRQDQRQFAEGFRPGKPYNKPKKKRTRDPLVAKHQELQQINKDRHPRLDRLGRLLLHPGAYPGVCEKARVEAPVILQTAYQICTEGTDECPIIRRDAMRAEVQQIREEINNWNLINGLHFELEQIGGITEAFDRAVADVRLATGRMDACDLLDEEARAELEDVVREVLTPGQLQVISEYNPCLLPPKDLKDPVRVGQANDSSRMISVLERARHVPEDQLDSLARQIIERETRHYGKLDDHDRLRRERLIVNTARKAQEMDDTEFELNKAELAAGIEREDRPLTLRAEIDQMAQQRGRLGLVGRFLVNDQFMCQLKYRGQQLAEGVQHAQADLTKGAQAENCDHGCAVKN